MNYQDILEELNSFTHYYRSKFSKDCSRSETEEEKNTEMLEADKVKDLFSYALSKVRQQTIEEVMGCKPKEQKFAEEYIDGVGVKFNFEVRGFNSALQSWTDEINKLNSMNNKPSPGAGVEFETDETKESISYYVKPHKKNSREVEFKDIETLKRDAQIMYELCSTPVGIYNGGFAVAHSQINNKDPLRFFVTNDNHVIVNPVMIDHTKTTVDSLEGCLTFSDLPMKTVSRYNKCKVKYQLFDGETLIGPFEENVSGRLSKVYQHEIDHFNSLYIFNF